jgi:VanZ family protein
VVLAIDSDQAFGATGIPMRAQLTTRLTSSARLLFWFALLTVVATALLPASGLVQGHDKVQHVVAFLVLGALGAFGWGRSRLPAILSGLAALGAGLEVAQATSLIGRDGDVMDWLADLLGLLLGLATGFALRGTRG